MDRIRLAEWLCGLDDDLASGRGKDPLYLIHVRELLGTMVAADNGFDAGCLELQDLQRRHGVRLLAPHEPR